MTLRLYSTWLLILLIGLPAVLPDDMSQPALAAVGVLAAANGRDANDESPQASEEAMLTPRPAAASIRKPMAENTRSAGTVDASHSGARATAALANCPTNSTLLDQSPLRL